MASGDGAAENGAEEKVTEGGFICRHEMFACDLCGLPVKRGERIYPGKTGWLEYPFCIDTAL